MRSLQELLAAPTLRDKLVVLSSPAQDSTVERVALVVGFGDLQDVRPGSLVLLSGSTSARIETYRLDIALRLAGEHGLRGLVLCNSDLSELTPTTTAVANRAGIAVLRTVGEVDLSELVVAIDRELNETSGTWLARAVHALGVVEHWHEANDDGSELVAAVGDAFGVPLELRDPNEADLCAAVVINGRREGYVCASRTHGTDDGALRLVLQLTAQAVAQARAATRHRQEVPVRSRAELLTELLLSEPRDMSGLLHRARSLGISVDGWHVVIRIELGNVAEAVGDDTVAVFECTEQVARIALQAARASGGVWHRAGAGTTLLLIRMERTDPGMAAADEAARVADRVLERVLSRFPALEIRCGVSTVHTDSTGLRAAAAEAHAAVTAARAGNRRNTVARFDAHGVRGMLVDWYASDKVQERVTALLAPIDALGSPRSEMYIETLRAFFDHQGSLKRTAEALHLHRNTVKYRIERIFDLLNVDTKDPEQWLVLQLACLGRTFQGQPLRQQGSA
jgi:sugar diacid utilization regulator